MEPTHGGGQYATPEAILAADDIRLADVLTPEWGEGMKVQVRGLTLGEILSLRKATGGDERLVVIHTLAMAMVQPRLDLTQAEALMAKSGAVTQRIIVAVNELNGVGPDGTPGVVPAQVAFQPGPGVAADPDAGPEPAPDQG